MNRVALLILFLLLPSISVLSKNISADVSYAVMDTTVATQEEIDDSLFILNKTNDVRVGYVHSDVWLKIPVTPDMAGKFVVLDNLSSASIKSFLTVDGIRYQEACWHRAENKDVLQLVPAFAIPDDLNQNQVLYVNCSSVRLFRFTARVMTYDEYENWEKQYSFLLGVLLGALVILLLYNLFNAFTLADNSYYLYVLYLITFILYQVSLSGIGALFGVSLIFGFLPLSVLILLSGGLFSISYLQLKRYSEKSYNYMIWFQFPLGIILLLWTLIAPNTLANMVIDYYAVLAIVSIICIGYITAKRGNRTAVPYLAGWSVLFVTGILYVMREPLHLPVSYWVDNLVLMGGVLSSMILSWGLAINIKEIQKDRELLQRRHENLKELVHTDELTGLYNKRYFEETVGKMLKEADRVLSIAVLDIDHFKTYNDTYGHIEGDTVLRVMGELFYDNIEESDIPIRYGGEEFVIIMPNTPLSEALERCELIRKRVEDLHFVLAKGTITRVTVSIGVAEAVPEESVNQLFMRADAALYSAKETGRNRVVEAGE